MDQQKRIEELESALKKILKLRDSDSGAPSRLRFIFKLAEDTLTKGSENK